MTANLDRASYVARRRQITRDSTIDANVFGPAFLAAIVECSSDAIVGKDLSGTILSWNQGAEAIFGYTADEMVGQSVQRLFPPDRLGEEDSIVERIRRGERVETFETVRRRKDGVDFPASVTISPIRDATGAVVGASKILRDVSEQHRINRELRDAKAELEQVVAERTRALAERDLLLREVYHRVKNNLQVVDGLLLMGALKVGDPDARQALNEVRSRVLALGLVHQQLMGSSDLSTFDLGPFLRELSGNLIDGAASERVTLTVDAHPVRVGMDFAIPLGLLVTELVTNSLKHAFSDRGGQITVTLRAASDGWVQLEVADDGRGFVASATPSASPARAGSGSAIIARLVAQLGGRLSVRSEAGTCTQILLPLPGSP